MPNLESSMQTGRGPRRALVRSGRDRTQFQEWLRRTGRRPE